MGKLRVLVADDCKDAADTLSTLLRIWGYEVRVAYDGASALETAYSFHPDVLLLDQAMPELDGCCVARRLRQEGRFHASTLIAVTGYTDATHRSQCDQAGFDLYLVKPVDLATLEDLLRHREADGVAVSQSGCALTDPRPVS